MYFEYKVKNNKCRNGTSNQRTLSMRCFVQINFIQLPSLSSHMIPPPFQILIRSQLIHRPIKLEIHKMKLIKNNLHEDVLSNIKSKQFSLSIHVLHTKWSMNSGCIERWWLHVQISLQEAIQYVVRYLIVATLV